jgi:glycosyltransferase involved in cell wall biosynthesis
MVSVVIPTLDRREQLLRTLRSLERQSPPVGGFEVIVADNGSSDGTVDHVMRLAEESSMPLRLVEDPTPGAAAPRNRGVEAAAGELIIFLGDDTEPVAADLLLAHAELHERAGDWRHAVLGRVEWSERQPITPFVEWIDRAGLQFDYERLRPGRVAAADAFWTAHVSLSRRLLEQAGGFDERLPIVEDVELGFRLDRAGIALHYHPELLVLHTHPTDLERSLRRQRRSGRSAAYIHEVHPDFASPGLPRPRKVRSWVLRATVPAWRILAALPAPRRLRELGWRALHSAAYARGFREGLARAPS